MSAHIANPALGKGEAESSILSSSTIDDNPPLTGFTPRLRESIEGLPRCFAWSEQRQEQMDIARYNRGARAFHWVLALLVIVNLATGLLHESLEHTVNLIPLHKSLGLTILLLTVGRLVWRMLWTRPPYPAAMARWETLVASATHAAFYFFLFAMPLTGWIIASAGKKPLSYFGLFDWPKFVVTRDSARFGFGHEFHEIGGYVLLALAVFHTAAALRHHFMLRDDVLRRMV